MARGSIQVRRGPHGVVYRVRAEYGPDPVSGRRKQRSRTFLSRRDAEAHLTRWQAEIARGTAIEPGTATLGEQARSWLATYARTAVSPQTFHEDERLLHKHVIPALGAVALQKLSEAHLEAFKAEQLGLGRSAPEPSNSACCACARCSRMR